VSTTGELELLAKKLASEHEARVGVRSPGGDMLSRLAANRLQLFATYRSIARAVENGLWISPAAEWLIDNFHVVKEQLREGRDDLPRGFYRELPRLVSGPMAGLPRAFAIAIELITQTDGQLDIPLLERFLTTYQETTPLTIGELWAIPISLRHAFLDRLAEIATRVEKARLERETALRLSGELQASASLGPEEVAKVLRERFTNRAKPSTTMFVTELLLRLRDQDPALAPATEWLESRLRDQGTTLDEATRVEHRSQATNQVSVGNAITSMRTITATDWSKVFERLSLVDRELRADPSGHYAQMDFATRDRYRHAVERIAKRSIDSEIEVAKKANALALAAAKDREKHVGFHLIDRGVRALEEVAVYRPKLKERIGRVFLAHATASYLLPIFVLTLLVAAGFGLLAFEHGAPAIEAVILAVLAFFPASEVAVSLVNLAVATLRAPQLLPKLDFLEAIPLEHHTLVAIPSLLTSSRATAELLNALEVRFLANQHDQLSYALVTDLPDSNEEERSDDRALVAMAERGIRRLNELHGADRFYFLHRRRKWNEGEQRYMGWERKRGKLVELNRLLLGADDTSFAVISGDLTKLRRARYVLTLDSDTQLPRDTASKLVADMAHPLNRPVIDAEKKLVVDGHAIVQPRVSVVLESAQRSRFSRIYSEAFGIDPYTSAVSDLYQDLFDEGSFVGKGIYDVRAFEQVLEGRIPEQTLLSHDLFEGVHARAGLASDIELFDDVPAHYSSHSVRRHRWTRGDWQMFPWLFGRVPVEKGTAPNHLSLLSRWKIFDNLRRSLIAPAILIFLFAGWAMAPGPYLWTGVVLALLAFPIFAHWLHAILTFRLHANTRAHLFQKVRESYRNSIRAALALLFLPEQAWSNADAIVRAFWRRHVSKRGMLEWVTAAEAEAQRAKTAISLYRSMMPALVVSALSLIAATSLHRAEVVPAIALAILWGLAPLVAWWVSQPISHRDRDATAVERYFLRRIARKTWSYFEQRVTAEDHWLPPDNYQEDPRPLVAHRTSPTNMGLALVANITALDLGYLGLATCLERIERALDAMDKLERFRGHFLNWYETTNLRALHPRYVSMVDSGNLAALLVALKQACLKIGSRPLFGRELFNGFIDTLHLLDEEIEQAGEHTQAALKPLSAALMALFEGAPRSIGDAVDRLTEISAHVEKLHERVQAVADANTGELLLEWSNALASAVQARLAEAGELASFALTSSDQASRSLEAPSLSALNGRAKLLKDEKGIAATGALLDRAAKIAARAQRLADEMDFRFLLHPERKVFSIGYDVDANRLDNSYYDLLASEARLGSFVAIAKGDVPSSHWFRLGRPLVQVGSERSLLSWTGTMFEYLMPTLLLKTYEGTLVDQTCRAVVKRQMEYGRRHQVPWGISESAYNARDLHLNYQYGPFGVPGLGIRRGLGEDLVVSPYSTMLALAVDPHAAVENLWALSAEGLEGRHGYYEAIDYTAERSPEGRRGAVIRAFMAHHQGMSLIAIGEHLTARRLSAAFHSDPSVQATELLLQERVPIDVQIEEPAEPESRRPRVPSAASREHWAAFDQDALPDVHLLSNGNYSVMFTKAGGGYSTCRGIAVTRWREDATRDAYGQFLYVRDLTREKMWSVAHQPLLGDPENIQVCFSLDKAELRRDEDEIEIHTLITVSTEDDAEIRAVTLTNGSSERRLLEVTSYAEVVLAPQNSDIAHPAFSNLFIETELVPESHALLATRRRRSSTDAERWAVHVSCLDTESPDEGTVEHETDRAKFLGRLRSPKNPRAFDGRRPLSGSIGSVLDPIFSLRRTVELQPNQRLRFLFTTAMVETREAALSIASKYATPRAVDRATRLAWTHAQAQLHYLDIDRDEVDLFLALASRLIYARNDLRAREAVIAQNVRGQSGLWAYGISGDVPILLVRVDSEAHIDLVRETLRAHELWRMRGFTADLVILNEHPPSYLQAFNDQLLAVVRSSASAGLMDKPGGIFVRKSDVMPPEDRTLLFAAARCILSGGRGTIAENIARLDKRALEPKPELRPLRPARAPRNVEAAPKKRKLRGVSPLGGFTEDGREYVIHLGRGKHTPAPWSNVMANRYFGSLVTESGGGYEWSENSHENRITEWSNDAITDPLATMFYVRDEESGAFWSPTPEPAGGESEYVVRHGQGYSIFEVTVQGIEHELLIFVAVDQPVKVARLRLTNRTKAPRKLTVTGCVEWTLGVTRAASAPHIVTQLDEESGAILARNTYPGELGIRVAFMDSIPKPRSYTCDRAELLGANGDRSAPDAMLRVGLSNRTGAALDPCTALQVESSLAAGESSEVVFLLGQTAELAHARAILRSYQTKGTVDEEYRRLTASWDVTLGAVQIETPDEDLDLLINRWMLYQVLSSRVFGRTGFYQSGGAFGFRDQLQDVAALVYSRPELAREHILRAAGRQFPEGDVQHWWHPPGGRGVRTRFADDPLWLVFITAHYVAVTGDAAILDEGVRFLEARTLEPHEHEVYLEPTISEESASLYEHCVLSIERTLPVGPHGLPLMGGGDWNDGMNRVGYHGQGESVWMAWFLIATIKEMLPLAAARRDTERAERYQLHADKLKHAVEEHAWDGDWYLRAFFDDGTPLGSASGEECRIDSLSQSWSVISGAGDQTRVRRALASVEEHLVDREARVVKLLAPAFDKTPLDPGYIKGYVPGVRENGGQYTHAAAWLILAYTKLGDGERAADLFRMLNPIEHLRTPEDLHLYRIEPYVLAGDVAAVPPHTGRGGWSWYTGSASWFYRVAVESFLGLKVRGDSLSIDPCIPKHWPGFTLTFRRKETSYRIEVENSAKVNRGVVRRIVDGEPIAGKEITIANDGRTHAVRIIMGEVEQPAREQVYNAQR
jgi:cellobiose phosphorylase